MCKAFRENLVFFHQAPKMHVSTLKGGARVRDGKSNGEGQVEGTFNRKLEGILLANRKSV